MSEVPLPQRSVSVGLSRQVLRGQQSTGVSIHITAEPESGLPAQPAELQQLLSDQARAALVRQASSMSPTDVAATDTTAVPEAPMPRSRRPRCRS